jgi:putative ABC transport system ATP-binding protein
MGDPAPIRAEGVNHYFGGGELRKQILFDVSVELRAGEICLVTGPSGSGKTTLLTLIGALRSTQEGSVQVLGEELRGASRSVLQGVRRQIGYIFQAHNLIDALSARQNVEMSLRLHRHASRGEVDKRARAMLEAVGLADRLDHHPAQLSGGQRQRVAIARALASHPRIILADEPTASLDKQSGRDVVDKIRELAREQGVTVLLVTHDNRILDVADRIIHLEDGRLQSFQDAVIANTRHMMGLLAGTNRKGELRRVVEDMPQEQFVLLLEQVTTESRQFLESTSLANDVAFESMLDQALEAFTFKLGRMLDCERASIFLVDADLGELWLKVAEKEGGRPVEVRMPMDQGIAGHVATTGESLRVDDAYEHPKFNPTVDRDTGFRTRSILCVPLRNADGVVFAVAQLLNRCDGAPFEDEDEKRFAEFGASLGVILETWWRMSRARRGG